MSNENVFDILKRNNLEMSGINYEMYKELSKTMKDEKEIVNRIIDYNIYIENNTNKYSEKIMKDLRQRNGLNKYDYSKDSQFNTMLPNEAFDEVVKWNGLMGGFSSIIKDWIKDIYKIDLESIE